MLEKLKEIILDYVDIKKENINADSRFMEDLGFTSFDFMSMLGEIEDQFDLEVSEQEIAEIHTVGEAAAYLERIAA